jgi:XRE family transcriptional regulator, fatty acid utilization regulator
MEAGERFVAELKLGSVPAARLVEVMEQELGILVLMVDAFKGISGAACRLPELDVVLINRHEVVGRRHFDLAHELFHILTWDAMPPEHSEEAQEIGGNRVEQLANNFASAVLMPAPVLDRFGDWSKIGEGELATRLNAVADELQVTASALKWRLVALDRLKLGMARAIPDAALRNNGRDTAPSIVPPPFSKPFMEVIALAVDAGRVSVRRVGALLDLTVDDLADLFATHGVQSPVEL